MFRAFEQIKKRALQRSFNRFFRWRLTELMAPQYAPVLDYPPQPDADWGGDKGAHSQLNAIIDRDRASYRSTIEQFHAYVPSLQKIGYERDPHRRLQPYWNNGFFDALDAVALYCFLAIRRPRVYVEIGSGNSTKFARLAINDFQLETKIISIDPQPRDDIDSLCDEVIRSPLQRVSRTFFERMGPGDFLFFDGSHRAFTNSDCTVFFLDIMPMLSSGILLHIHDIFIPYDYPLGFAKQYYSEQYVLAAWMLGGGRRLKFVLPNAFVSRDPELLQLAGRLFPDPRMKERSGSILGDGPYLGSSLWCEIE